MLSICIPVYNYNALPLAKEMVRQAEIEGVDFEILCYDDGSTLFEEQNKRTGSLTNVTYKKFSSNIGRTAIRQKLANNAKFDWLLFVDADMMPRTGQFIKDYLVHQKKSPERAVFFGGYAYKRTVKSKKLLRYKYGKKREEIAAKIRSDKPYKNVLSGNVFIKKSLFFEVNAVLQNRYGLDPLFSARLQDLKIVPSHIDNEVYHNGLETNSSFLEKSKEGAKTIGWLYHNNHINNHQSQLICAYEWLRKWKLLGVFKTLSQCAIKPTEKLLSIGKAPLILFDFFRLYYFIES